MSNAITYSVVARQSVPGNLESPQKYHAQAQARCETTLEEMATKIEERCTVTYADAVAVLTALEDRIIEALRNGEIVRLGKLGNLQVSVGCKSSLTKEEFKESLLRKPRVIFRPGKALRNTAKTARFEKVAKLKTAADTEDDGGGMLAEDPEAGGQDTPDQQV